MSGSDHSLDVVLLEIGQVGKYQLFMVTLFSIAVIIHSTVHIAFVFTAKDVDYRCEIPGCESEPPEYNSEWLPNAVPFKDNRPVKCEKFEHRNGSELQACSESDFDRKIVENCNNFVYKTSEQTIVNDDILKLIGIPIQWMASLWPVFETAVKNFDLHCEENLWKLTLVGTINSVGQFVGLPISGFVSDKYGRRTTLVWGMVLSGLAGLARSFTTDYIWFVVLEFIDAAFGAGAYSCGFILGVELVGPKKRVLIGTLISCSYAVGEIVTGGVAWLVQSWRPLVQILYAFPLLLLSYFWLTPESVRWLLAQKRYTEVITILKKAAKVNGKMISEENLSNLCNANEKTSEPVKYPITAMFKSVILITRFINCCFCWITCAFLFYGLTLNSVALAGNSYLDFILTSLVEIPGYVATYLIVDRIGRRASQCGSFLLTGVACIGFIFVPSDLYWLQLSLYLLGKFGATMAFCVCYIISSEIFPTPLRHSLMATCSMFGRIGSMVAPQMPLLEQVWTPLPLVLFGGMSTIAGFLALLFPETVNIKLPDTIAEAENIGKQDNQTKLSLGHF